MENNLFPSLQHVILPGSFRPGFSQTDLYNHAFRFWMNFWNRVYAANGTSDRADARDFGRSEVISLLMNGNEVVGMHLYSILNLERECTQVHPYLTATGDQCFIESLMNRGCRSAMPMEYLTVSESWRKSKVGFSFSPVVMGLGYKIQSNLGIGATLGRCRIDVKVDERMTEVGGLVLRENVLMHNTPTNFCAVFLDDLRPHPDRTTQGLIDRLWSQRIDYSQLTTETRNQNTRLKAS